MTEIVAETVTADEVMEVLRSVGDGRTRPQPTGLTWDEVYAGDVEFRVGEWTVVVFNDCDGFDYIDRVTAPDDRSGEFDDWIGPPEADGYRPWRLPSDLLSLDDPDCFSRMVEAFKEAT